MNRQMTASIAAGAAGAIAANRLATRPALAATAAAAMAAAGVYAALEPDIVIVLAAGMVVFAVAASAGSRA